MTSPAPLDLNESVQKVLDGSGNGIARITPNGARLSGFSWQVSAISVSVSTNIKEAVASVYLARGNQEISNNTFLAATTSGSTGDTCGVGLTIRPGDWIMVQWTGGDAGAVATMRITGTVSVPGGS